MIPFHPTEVRRGSSSSAEWEYIDEATGRHFEVRLLERATAIEVAADKEPASANGGRYFVSEFLPNGRLGRQTTGKDFVFYDIPAAKWRRAARKPSTANALLAKAERDHPGFRRFTSSGGLGLRSIFYPSLAACGNQIQNALDADFWLCDEEPIKCIVLAERCEITLEAQAELQRMPGNEQISAAIADIGAHLAPAEQADISAETGIIRIEVRDRKREYPDSCRLMLRFLASGRVEMRVGFVRGDWGTLADRLAGRELPRYDGPAGLARGFPAYGQRMAAQAAEPAGIERVEVLHKQKGTSNKIYAVAQVNGRWFHVWGRYPSGRFQQMPAEGTGYAKMAQKRSEGYEPIAPAEVPDFWDRLQVSLAKLP